MEEGNEEDNGNIENSDQSDCKGRKKEKKTENSGEDNSEESFTTVTRRKPKLIDALTTPLEMQRLEEYYEKFEHAYQLINYKKILDLGYHCRIVNETHLSFGVVEGIDIGIEEQEILENLTSSCEISSVKRLKRLDINEKQEGKQKISKMWVIIKRVKEILFSESKVEEKILDIVKLVTGELKIIFMKLIMEKEIKRNITFLGKIDATHMVVWL
ncbi:unnamed protein product [Parnassius apollo]|uniref:(apollo) hypothetical protein n=1 Tax=Parnassius apollo TaxID=110799 RepID=A0A8S3XR71_PARAO|nr:unnamed protein product [Parnassius apollo]